MNYPKLRKNLSIFLMDRHITKKFGELEKLYKQAKTFNTESENFTVKFLTVGVVGKTSFYQLITVLEDEDGKLFKHISSKMNYIKMSKYISNRFEEYLTEQPFKNVLAKTSEEDLKKGVTSSNAYSIDIQTEVKDLYNLNYSLKTVLNETFFIDPEQFTIEYIDLDNTFNLFVDSENIEKNNCEIKKNNENLKNGIVVEDDDEDTFAERVGG